MKYFLKNNWANITTLAISIIAIFLSLQSNQLSKQAIEIASPKLEVTFLDSPSPTFIYIDACLLSYPETRYTIEYHSSDVFIINNSGGLKTSLIDINLNVGDKSFRDLFAYKQNNNVNTNIFKSGEKITLPVDIEAGTARRWGIEVITFRGYKTIEEALNSISMFDFHSDIQLYDTQTGYWEFIFGDNTILKLDAQAFFVTGNKNIEEAIISNPCEFTY